MSSCYKKTVNVEKYGTPPRTPYDQQMNKMYDPNSYYSAPFPMEKTRYDMMYELIFCPNCKHSGHIGDAGSTGCNVFKVVGPPLLDSPMPNPYKEMFSFPRTPYDQQMNKMYDPSSYYAPPFRMDRTRYDMSFLELSCPHCKTVFKTVNPPSEENPIPSNLYKNHNSTYEGYNSKGCAINKFLPALSLEDNDNPLSYGSYRC